MNPIVIDTEGSGLFADDGARVSVVSWAYRLESGEIESGAAPFGQGAEPNLFEKPEAESIEVWNRLLDMMESGKVIYHNACHDLHQLAAGTICGYPGRHLVDSFYWDSQIAQRNLDPLEKVGLEPSCVRRLALPPWKHQLTAWNKKTKRHFDLIPWDIIKPYATEDAINTLLLYEDQWERYKNGEGNIDTLYREFEISNVLYWMEERGVGFDKDSCLEDAEVLRTMLREAVKPLPDELKDPTPAKICAFYYDKLGYPLPLDKKGNPTRSADDYSRKRLAEQHAPYIPELDHWASLETALTMWYQTWPERVGPDNRLRMRVRQTKVTSGRFSGERVNLLAIPHDRQIPDGVRPIRSFFQPAKGKRLYEVDLSQAEVRVGAVAVRCQPLIAAYQQGHDVYELTARDVFNKTTQDADFKHYRDLCKRIVLSTLYAAGPKTLAVTCKKFMNIDLAEEEAFGFLQTFRSTYPEFKKAEKRYMAFVEKNRYVPLALGERRYFQPYEQSYKALNQRVQGSVAVGMKVCMIEVEKKFPGTLLLQTHDSLLLETAEDEVPQLVAKIMERNFEEIFKLPFSADIKEWV